MQFKKIIALITVFTFAVTPIAQSVPIASRAGFSSTPAITLPDELGSIRDINLFSPETPLVVHIQDAHGNYSAQKNIQNIIEYLHTHHGFKLLLIEGAATKLDPKHFQPDPNPEVIRLTADILTRGGEFSGAENFLLNHEGTVEAYGIENADLYRKNLEQFRQIMTKKISAKNLNTENLFKNGNTSKPLKNFTKEWVSFSKNNSSLQRFVNTLTTYSNTYLGISLENAKNQIKYPSLSRVAHLKQIEKNIDFKKAQQEREVLNHKLGTRLNNIESAPAPRIIFEKMFETEEKWFHPENFPHFSLYVRYLILKSEIDGVELYREIDALTGQIHTHLAQSDAERNWLKKIKQSLLREKLLNLELSRTEFDLADQDAELKSEYKNEFNFYDLAKARESYFVRNTLKHLAQSNSKRAILITGGFHSSGIKKLFSDDKISFVEIQPQVIPESGSKKVYVNALLGKPLSLNNSQLSNAAQLIPSEEQKRLGVSLSQRQLNIQAAKQSVLNASSLGSAASNPSNDPVQDAVNTLAFMNALGSGIGAIMSFSKNGRYVVAMYKNKTFKIFDLEGQTEISLPNSRQRVISIVFKERGNEVFALIGHEDNSYVIMNPATKAFEQVPQKKNHVLPSTENISALIGTDDAERIIPSEDHKIIVAHYKGGVIKVFDFINRKEIPIAAGNNVKNVLVSPINRHLIVLYNDKTAKVFDLRTAQQINIPIKPGTTDVSFSPDGIHILTKNYEYRIADRGTVWVDPEDLRQYPRTVRDVGVYFTASLFDLRQSSTPVKEWALGGNFDTYDGYDKPFPTKPKSETAYLSPDHTLAKFSPTGAHVVTIRQLDRQLAMYNIQSKTEHAVRKDTHTYSLPRDEKLVAVKLVVDSGLKKGEKYTYLHLYHTDKGDHLQFTPKVEKPFGITFSPDGQFLHLSGATHEIVEVKNTKSFLFFFGTNIDSVHFSPKGQRVVIVYKDGSAKVFDIKRFFTNSVLKQLIPAWGDNTFLGLNLLSELAKEKTVQDQASILSFHRFFMAAIKNPKLKGAVIKIKFAMQEIEFGRFKAPQNESQAAQILAQLDKPEMFSKGASLGTQTKTALALKTLTSIAVISGIAYLIYGTPLKAAAVSHLGVNLANILIFGYFTVMNDFLGQWLSGRGVIKKQVAWALPLGLVLGIVTWGGFKLTNLAVPKDVPIPVLAADLLRVGGIWMMIRFRTMLYAKMVSLVRKNGKSSEEQAKQFESFWMTRPLSFVKNLAVLKLIPEEFQTVAEGIANQYFQLFYSWSVNKTGFIFQSPTYRSSRFLLAFFPITATVSWMINRHTPPAPPAPHPMSETNASSLGLRSEKNPLIFTRVKELMLLSDNPRIHAEAASTETFDLPFSNEQIENIPVNSLAQFAFRHLLKERGLIDKTNAPIDVYQQALLEEELHNALHGRKQLAEAVGRMKEVHAVLKSRLLQDLDPTKPIFALIGAGIAGSEVVNQIKKQNPQAQFVIFDSNPLIGGKILYAIPAFRPRVKLPYLTGKMGIANFLDQEGIYLVPNFEIGRNISYSDFAKLPFDGVIFAGGNAVAKTDSIEGAQGSDVYVSTDIYRPYNTKELKIPDNNSYPDTESLVTGKTVVIIGGGNVSLDVARIALEKGAKKAVLLYRRGMDVFMKKTDKAERQGAEAAGTTYKMNTKATKVIRDPDTKKITHVEIESAGTKTIIQADLLVFAISDVLSEGIQRKSDSATIVDKIENPNFEWIAAGDSAVAGGGKAGASLTSARREFKRVDAQGTKTAPDREALIDHLVQYQASSLGYSSKISLDFPDLKKDRDYPMLRKYSAEQGRALPRSIALTARYFAGNFLYIPGAPGVLNSYMRILGISNEPVQLNSGVMAFNQDENLEKFLAYLKKESVNDSLPMLVHEQILKSPDSGQAAKIIAGAFSDNDLIIVALSSAKIPPVVSNLHRFGNRFKVKTLRKKLISAERISGMTQAYKIPPVAVFSIEDGMDIQLAKGDRIKLDLKTLIANGVDPIKVLTLIRKISDEPALRQILFLQSGFQFNKALGVWEVGNAFIAHLDSIYSVYKAAQQTARAA